MSISVSTPFYSPLSFPYDYRLISSDARHYFDIRGGNELQVHNGFDYSIRKVDGSAIEIKGGTGFAASFINESQVVRILYVDVNDVWRNIYVDIALNKYDKEAQCFPAYPYPPQPISRCEVIDKIAQAALFSGFPAEDLEDEGVLFGEDDGLIISRYSVGGEGRMVFSYPGINAFKYLKLPALQKNAKFILYYLDDLAKMTIDNEGNRAQLNDKPPTIISKAEIISIQQAARNELKKVLDIAILITSLSSLILEYARDNIEQAVDFPKITVKYDDDAWSDF